MHRFHPEPPEQRIAIPPPEYLYGFVIQPMPGPKYAVYSRMDTIGTDTVYFDKFSQAMHYIEDRISRWR